jgi:predicted nucleotidyltransferase
VEIPADVAQLLSRLRDGLLARGGLVGVYLYGSLATGDFSPARSDIDVVVILEREPDKRATSELRKLHMELAAPGGIAARLHCLYVAVETAADPALLCIYWFGNRMTQWRLKVMTRAELASAGIALHGPWPPPAIKPVPVADLQVAVREEITGYWRRIARQRARWLRDSWVDLGLTVLPRAEAVLTAGELITKTEAIGRLADFGVPAPLVQEIRCRRQGQVVMLSVMRRLRRARLTRQIMRREVRRLSRLGAAGPAGPATTFSY